MEHQPKATGPVPAKNEIFKYNVPEMRLCGKIHRGLKLFCLFAAFLCYVNCHAQPEYSSFTVKDGLPSNHVYRVVEDDHGFLWVATDAGIARFDGKYFQVFTTAEGLPDNEVLSVVKENNGRIWVNCFRQSPAYFDERKNRFINASEDSLLAKVSSTTGMFLQSLAEGGVMYYNINGNFIFKDGGLTVYNKSHNIYFFIKKDEQGNLLHWRALPGKANALMRTGMYVTKNNKDIDSAVVLMKKSEFPNIATNNGKLYVFRRHLNRFYIYSNLSTRPFHFQLDSFTVPETFVHFDFTPTSLYLIAGSGKMYVYDKALGKLTKVISGDYLVNSYYDDRNGNEWISTVGKGLIVYRKNRFNKISLPVNFDHRNFLSVFRKENGNLLAGNFYGEVVEVGADLFKVHKLPVIAVSRQRKIISASGRIFTFSDVGSYIDFKIPITNPLTFNVPHPAKTAILFNDTTIIIGFSSGILKMDTRNNVAKRAAFQYIRVTSLVKANDSAVYFGSTDGLYSYNVQNDTHRKINTVPPIRITSLSYTPDGLLWIATGGEGILVLKNEKVFGRITQQQGLLDNSIRCITNAQPGSVWMGTSHGISILNYEIKNNRLETSFHNINVNDGLSGNEINELHFSNDTMYAATGDGITVLPAAISVLPSVIRMQVINLKVNGAEMPIQGVYELEPDQQNISIRVSGIDLSGHFKKLEYMLDKNGSWISSTENTFNFQLNHGDHEVKLRAIDVNGKVSSEVLVLHFNIATPFYKTIWFMVLAGLLIQAIVIYSVWYAIRSRKRSKLEKQIAVVQNASLEQQAFTSLMNPHFMFNALNSIQHYINVQDRQNANRYLTDFASLIRKNFESAQQSFIPLDQELENLKIYLRLEHMRFPNRFSYEVNVAENVDVDQWMIPTMMLQPLLENALLHGLIPSTSPGKLQIALEEKNKRLYITITDNGIGIENSLASKSGSDHKSHGLTLIRKRIAAFSHFGPDQISIHTKKAFDNKETPGNKIVISIPAQLYPSWLSANAAGVDNS
jgi:ligand-binding sensor domain-containing protein